MGQQKIFPAASFARREISKKAYILFAVGAGVLICGASMLGMAFAGETPKTIFLVLAGGLGCAGLAGLIVGAATLTQLRKTMRVEVGEYRLVWREGTKTAVIEYENLIRLELLRDSERRRNGVEVMFPVVRFIERTNDMTEFEITFEDRGYVHLGRFDTYGILETLVPHLPTHVILSPALEDYLQSGEVDIDVLPER